MDPSLLERVEKQRLELEVNVAKLRKALQHWQTLELDYEGLKDEFQGLEDTATKQDYLDTARDFAPHKVDDKELNDLIEPNKGKLRLPTQVVETLTKRVEYVTRNIESLRRQISDLEKQRNALLLAENADHEDGAGLPISEITEELDEEGNIISSKVEPQSETATKVLDVLEKAKVEPTSIAEEAALRGKEDGDAGPEPDVAVPAFAESQEQILISDSVGTKTAFHDDQESSINDEFPSNPDDTEEEAQLRREMLQYGLGEVNNIVAELELAEGDTTENEDYDEDVEMADPLSDEEVDSWDEEDSDPDDEDVDGQIKHSEKYKRQMEQLEEQLGMKIENVGPTPDLPKEIQEQIKVLPNDEVDEYIETLPPQLREQLKLPVKPPPKEAARQAAIARAEANKSAMKDNMESAGNSTSSKSKSKLRKKVAFAPDLDIAKEETSEPTSKAPPTTTETVIERPATSTASNVPPPVPTQSQKIPSKPSRFKASRANQATLPQPTASPSSSSTPTLKPTPTHSQTLIERAPPNTSTSSSSAPLAPDPNDFDTALQTRQIALEHHRLHNKLVHENGGYVRGGEDENWGEEFKGPEFVDERTGEVRKVSRFKAARMR